MKKQINLISLIVFAVVLAVQPQVNAASASATTNAVASTAAGNKSADAMTALFGDPVIAKGKGFEIKRSELDEVVSGIKSAAAARGQTIPPGQLTQIAAELLKRIIQDRLLLQKATDVDRSNGVERTTLQMKALLDRFGTQEALERQMKATGLTVAELTSKLTLENTAQAVKVRVLDATATDAEVKQYYDDTNHQADFEQPELAHIRNILLLTIDPVTHAPLPADQQQAKRKQIDDLLKRIRGGADFATLAKQYSEDPASKDNGGELPALSREQMTTELAAAAFSMTNNQVSDVIITVYGYHVIKLLDKTPAKRVALTDKIPSTNVTVADRIKDYLTQQKTERLSPAYMDKLEKAADVQILDADLKAAAAAAASATGAAPEK
jgi:parvulin-like peptidyl-prolyl isomerase